ncbi:hypothetical protein BS78_05G170600 [Paspalum vaginatum]|nr:hypothetical protein BS78_05G170600 [Paspalum vaginatum]
MAEKGVMAAAASRARVVCLARDVSRRPGGSGWCSDEGRWGWKRAWVRAWGGAGGAKCTGESPPVTGVAPPRWSPLRAAGQLRHPRSRASGPRSRCPPRSPTPAPHVAGAASGQLPRSSAPAMPPDAVLTQHSCARC